jgi:tripartite-type tricarboxylate transporter receptor subunit TctC
LGGRIDVMFDTVTVSISQIRGGTIRAIGVSTQERVPSLPDVPPIGDTLPGFDVGSWFALFLPGKTPPEIVASISADVQAALRHEPVKARIEELGGRVVASTPDALAPLYARGNGALGQGDPRSRDQGAGRLSALPRTALGESERNGS